MGSAINIYIQDNSFGETRSPTQRNAVGIKILFSDIYAKELILTKFVNKNT